MQLKINCLVIIEKIIMQAKITRKLQYRSILVNFLVTVLCYFLTESFMEWGVYDIHFTVQSHKQQCYCDH